DAAPSAHHRQIRPAAPSRPPAAPAATPLALGHFARETRKHEGYQYSSIFNEITGGGGGGGSAATGPITGYQGLCLDDRSASTADFNPIQVYTCNGTNAQQWTVESNNTLQVLGKCLDVNAAGTANGTTVDLYDCNGTGAQTWVPQSDGALLNPGSGKCLDDTGFGGAGTQAQIWSCTGSANQAWKLP
ncbi:MAG: ricin-type beta-trefoil lectin domain protein, partial [Streptosporangiaceae bacterium]